MTYYVSSGTLNPKHTHAHTLHPTVIPSSPCWTSSATKSHHCSVYDPLVIIVQALKSKAFNHFTAIYFLLLDRWQKYTRLFSTLPQAEHRLAEEHRRPSTVADQALIRFAIGAHPPTLSDTRTGPFSRTTDGVTPVDLNAPHLATQQQRIYTSGPQPSAAETGLGASGPRRSVAKMSIDEGVELEGSENSYEILNPPQTAASVSAARTDLISFSSSGGSSDVASFDSTADADILAGTVQSTPWPFTSGESLASTSGLECVSAGVTSQEFPTENPPESSLGTGPVGNYPQVVDVIGRCHLAVPGPSNTLQVPAVAVPTGSQDGFFHSGRRASDGLATRNDILQLQQLMKTRGVPELQKELESLAVPVDPRQTAEPRVRRTEQRHGRSVHQHSFEEGSCTTGGRLSPFSSRKSRQGVSGSFVRPRLSVMGRSRPPVSGKSPLAELTTLCRMLPTGGTPERNRSPVSSEQQLLQQQFQQLGIDGTSGCQPTSAVALLPTSSGLVQLPITVGQPAVVACLSDQRLAATSPATTVPDVSACRSQDCIHSYTVNESIVGQPVTALDDGSTGSVRRHMVRRTLYRLVHQQTLISSFGEEDIPEVSPVSEQAAGDSRQESHPSTSMDVTWTFSARRFPKVSVYLLHAAGVFGCRRKWISCWWNVTNTLAEPILQQGIDVLSSEKMGRTFKTLASLA